MSISAPCASATILQVVAKATSVVTWPTPAPIVYGVPLGNAQLNATANTAGTFSYSISPGTILAAGVHPMIVAFTPTDATDFTTALGSVNLVVNKATPALTWPVPAAIIYGTPLGAAQLDAFANVPGIFTYGFPAGTVLIAGAHLLSVTFAPTDSTDYVTTTANVNLFVNQAAPRLPGRFPRRLPTAPP